MTAKQSTELWTQRQDCPNTVADIENGFSFLTYNTGHCLVVKPYMVWQDTIETLKPFVSAGGGELAGFSFRAVPQPQGAVTLDFGVRGIATSVGTLCYDPKTSADWWRHLGQSYARICFAYPGLEDILPATGQCPPVPWLAVILLPTLAALDPMSHSALADFEKCVAMTLLSVQAQPVVGEPLTLDPFKGSGKTIQGLREVGKRFKDRAKAKGKGKGKRKHK